MIILAIDPGNVDSAYCHYDTAAKKILAIAKVPNETLRDLLPTTSAARMVIEMVACYGMPVGATIFDTCVWIGRYRQVWEDSGRPSEILFRKDIKLHLCGSPRAKDPNVRQALMDRYGSSKEVAIGKKKTPGPLFGVTADQWAALAVAITWGEQHEDASPSLPAGA